MTAPASLDGPMITISTFRNATDTRPTRVASPWPLLARKLTQHAVRNWKDGPGWAPTVYTAGRPRASAALLEGDSLSGRVPDDGTAMQRCRHP